MLQQQTVMAEMASGDLYCHIDVFLYACVFLVAKYVLSLYGIDFVDMIFVIQLM